MKYYYLKKDDAVCYHLLNSKVYYFDNNSTTLIYDKDVKKGIITWISCGNPSNTLHDYGEMTHLKVEECRNVVSRKLCISPEELYFTSGATESNNIIIQGIVNHHLDKYPKKQFTIITSAFEHSSVINVFKHLEENDKLQVLYVNPNINKNSPNYGCILPKDVEEVIKKAKYKIILLSIMHANNETGAIQDIKSIGSLARKYNIFFHSDVTQSLGKYAIYPKRWFLSAISFSAHKFHGPKGIGGLYLEEKYHDMVHLCYGGAQESQLRPGTENVANIVGMRLALDNVRKDRKEKNKRLFELKSFIIDGLREHMNIHIIGPEKENALPNTIFVLLEDLKTCNKELIKELNKKRIYISVGSACQTENEKASHVLDIMQIKDKHKVIRISMSDYTTLDECKLLVNSLTELINKKTNL